MRPLSVVQKTFIIIEMVFLYIVQLIPLIMLIPNVDYPEIIDKYWLPAWVLLSIIPFVIGIVTSIMSAVIASKGEKLGFGFMLISKLCMIPWFVLNFVMWFVVVGGLLNPFLMVGIPIAIVIGVCETYVYMLTLNLPKVIYVLKRAKKTKRTKSKKVTIALILEFIFCLDVLGDILLFTAKNNV